MSVKLHEITRKLVQRNKLSSTEKCSWFSRFCVDMTTREIVSLQNYFKVLPYNRIFVWPQDVSEAVERLVILANGFAKKFRKIPQEQIVLSEQRQE